MAKKIRQELDRLFAESRERNIATAKPTPRPRGRPRLVSEAELIGRRDSLVSLLEPSWGEIGWELKKARAVGDLVKAMRPFANQARNYPIHLLLEERTSTCSPLEIRRTRRDLGKASQEARLAREAYDRQAEVVAEAKTALSQAGDDASIVKVVQEELQRRQTELDRLGLILEKAKNNRGDLEKRLREQEAYITQTELLRFLRSRRYAFTPRNLSNAIAGLPYIGWRQSFRRSARTPCQMAVSLLYQVFEAVVYILRDTMPASSEAALRLFRAEVPRLPKKHETARQYLSGNWLHAKEAIEECWKIRPHLLALPFKVTALFNKNLTRPRTALDRVLAAIELSQIDRPKPSK